MGFFDFLIKDIETNDTKPNKDLQTHYYKCEYREAKEALLRYLKKNNYEVSNIDDKYGEIFVETPSFHMIFSIRKAGILNVSIDIKVNVYRLIGGYKPHKLIKEAYKYLDKEIPFMGIGLQIN
ncbi:hypothetical protein KHQ81_09860 [Mycoplasmatota bacterium]|nr:hypothetical protein KHQ81_09860 [Mycoplasmatota bacterium]